MTVEIQRTSRLAYATLRELGGKTFFEKPDMPVIEAADDDLVHIVEDTDRMDLLSNRYYGTPRLAWVIMRVNGMQLLPRDMKLQQELIIPSRRRVFADIIPRFVR